MASAKTQPARGMRDFLPEEVRRREYVIGVIKEVYERYGFEPLETPAVENIETLMGKYGEEGNQLIFKILKRGVHESTGEADLALRYDLTVPLARVVAEYRDKLPKFFKRYQIQPVWRADRPARGRFREFYQCDVDVLGSKSMIVEAELLAAVCEVLKRLDFDQFTIRLNDRRLLDAMLSKAGIDERIRATALTVIDKFEKIGRSGVERELLANNLTKESVDILFILLLDRAGTLTSIGDLKSRQLGADRFEANMRVLSLIEQAFQFDEEEAKTTKEVVESLRRIVELSRHTSATEHIMIDPSLARGLSYYTGSIFEINVPDLPGSLGGGGRYDNLVGMFLGSDVPACGFSLGLERIIVVMTERGMFPPQLTSSPADVMVTIWNEESINEAIALAHELRSAGLRVDLYPEADKLGKQFKYASARSVPFVVVIGDDERSRGTVTIKNMATGVQETVERAGIIGKIRGS